MTDIDDPHLYSCGHRKLFERYEKVTFFKTVAMVQKKKDILNAPGRKHPA